MDCDATRRGIFVVFRPWSYPNLNAAPAFRLTVTVVGVGHNAATTVRQCDRRESTFRRLRSSTILLFSPIHISHLGCKLIMTKAIMHTTARNSSRTKYIISKRPIARIKVDGLNVRITTPSIERKKTTVQKWRELIDFSLGAGSGRPPENQDHARLG